MLVNVIGLDFRGNDEGQYLDGACRDRGGVEGWLVSIRRAGGVNCRNFDVGVLSSFWHTYKLACTYMQARSIHILMLRLLGVLN